MCVCVYHGLGAGLVNCAWGRKGSSIIFVRVINCSRWTWLSNTGRPGWRGPSHRVGRVVTVSASDGKQFTSCAPWLSRVLHVGHVGPVAAMSRCCFKFALRSARSCVVRVLFHCLKASLTSITSPEHGTGWIWHPSHSSLPASGHILSAQETAPSRAVGVGQADTEAWALEMSLRLCNSYFLLLCQACTCWLVLAPKIATGKFWERKL